MLVKRTHFSCNYSHHAKGLYLRLHKNMQLNPRYTLPIIMSIRLHSKASISLASKDLDNVCRFISRS